MDELERGEACPGESPVGALPWILLGLGLLLAAGVVFVRSWPSSDPVRVEPPERTETLVGGWEVEWEPGSSVAQQGGLARLEPLHSRPSRQAFDGAALSRVLEQAGEPWLLVLPPDLAAETCEVQLGEGGTLKVVPPGSHPVQRVLHATSVGSRRVLFGPAPQAPTLMLNGVRHPMQFRERPMNDEPQPLLEAR